MSTTLVAATLDSGSVDDRLSGLPDSPRSILARARSWGLSAPVKAFRDTVALPCALFGPLDFCHGFHRLIASACRARRSDVHPFAICRLQKFDLPILEFRLRNGAR